MAHVFTVRELTGALGAVVEGAFPFVWVRGQVSNLARPASGHVYFSLKDGEAVLAVVWFRRNQWLGQAVHPLTGEVCADEPLELRDGQEVLVAGRLTVYGPRGTYQLAAELVQEEGAGRLQLEFEALKRELAGLGYFDQSRKRPLPANPARVAVVTAATGAAICDFLRLARERGAGAAIRIHASLVQGEAAPGAIAAALDDVGRQGWAQVVAVIRGGGSVEDLAAFNSRAVAEAVFRCPLPVVSGVGHEVDVSLCDLTADLRAATPSHAAQLLWPGRDELRQRCDDLAARLDEAWANLLAQRARSLDHLDQALGWLAPAARLERASERLAEWAARLSRAGHQTLDHPTGRLDRLVSRLLHSLPPERLAITMSLVDTHVVRLSSASQRHVDQAARRLEALAGRLAAVDPHAPLARGYALVRDPTGRVVRDAAQVSPGQALDIRLGRGRLAAEVVGVEPEPGREG